ncbi:Demethylmenaquinone methyltransferase [bioreactor metagenome]|uniref:Demethylmenaquinone methyltransferase n=1 Tax=bioreactor metagenome TaxID=1076179 RepID=A0A644YMV7_9ZZZZ|nr:bifunctional demethylmenaquinone methyltransferase/2-methoxy-6-polyprenyl-1,4-benzoquinol methylase UbiE [Rikenellaceae bacterium]
MGFKINKDKQNIAAMFNSIAGSYDLLNHLLSFGIDKSWRAFLIKRIKLLKPATALDIACGTGDITIAMMKQGIDVTGLDIADKMLEKAVAKSKKAYYGLTGKGKGASSSMPKYICAPADNIPLPDNSFDVVTIGFGIRNFDNRGESLLEIKRVLKPGGTLFILEFATPKNRVWRGVFNTYFLKVLPYIGKVISGDNSAYSYLPSSVGTFPQYGEFMEELEHFGFKNPTYKQLTGGVAVMYSAQKSHNT